MGPKTKNTKPGYRTRYKYNMGGIYDSSYISSEKKQTQQNFKHVLSIIDDIHQMLLEHE